MSVALAGAVGGILAAVVPTDDHKIADGGDAGLALGDPRVGISGPVVQ